MNVEVKDIVALIVIILTFIGLLLNKISIEVAIPIISSILFFYIGVKIGYKLGRSKNGRT